MLAPHIDAYRVDVKGFSDDQYRELCRIREMEPVLEAAVRAQKVHDCHVEIVTNVIPTFNDDEETLGNLRRTLAAAQLHRHAGGDGPPPGG